ncbi:hypothetical protein HG535_0D04340 [Zygotorulaspora mrakii]|uniref:Uncharacterized protein n=1 Tax=Zygotorulaspora mrakii TaxID=42260 RepID=A0A7H9B2S5_ZYGMR|nr:uncharacterized protein HG535_0D04340 [Zygotorulaspora mrakii]QLG72726.1 hypothetical protein HG535_0D04340 [Zygotorulaspora mrakii]
MLIFNCGVNECKTCLQILHSPTLFSHISFTTQQPERTESVIIMHWNSRFIEINTSKSLLNIRDVPGATQFLTLSYTIFSTTLYVLRRSTYNKLEKSDDNLEFSSIVSPILQLIPATLLKYPYSIVLSNLIDVKIWKAIANLVFLLIGGSHIERSWNSSKELLKFVLIIGSLTNMLTVTITATLSLFFPAIDLNSPLDGNYTMIIGFPIILKQLYPETTIFRLKNLGYFSKNFRFKLLPIFIMFILTFSQLFVFHHFAQLLSIWITFFSSWTYLRFYQVLQINFENTGDCLLGDASDTFQLIYFFPDLIKPVLRPIFDFTYNILSVRLKIVRSFEIDDIDRGNSVAEHRGAKKITNTTEERRKQLALQILQERMVEP